MIAEHKGMGWPGLTSKAVKRNVTPPTINTAQADLLIVYDIVCVVCVCVCVCVRVCVRVCV